MSQPLAYQSAQVRPASPNVLGIVGFVFVVIGLAGFYAPPAFVAGGVGAILCGVALFNRPRGLAIAGLVVGIIEIVVAVLFLTVVGIYYGSKARTAMQDAQLATSAQHAATISFAIDAYKRQNGALPPNLNALPPLGADALDGFGNSIRYVPNLQAQTYKLMSDCWDGKPNTADDSTLFDTSIKHLSTVVIPTIPRRQPTPEEHEARLQSIASYDGMIAELSNRIEALEKSGGPNVDAENLADLKSRLLNIQSERARLAAADAASTRPTLPAGLAPK
jgi:hypothetical protein